MAKGALPRRYAESVLAIARDKGNYEEWQSDLHLLSAFLQDEQLAGFLESPAVGIDEKRRALQSLLAARVHPYALNLVLVLAHQRHTMLVGAISARFDEMVDQVRNRVVAHVTTAVVMDADEERKVRERLHQLTGKEVVLHPSIDGSIIAGFVARIGDTLLDASIAQRLERMRQQILNLTEA